MNRTVPTLMMTVACSGGAVEPQSNIRCVESSSVTNYGSEYKGVENADILVNQLKTFTQKAVNGAGIGCKEGESGGVLVVSVDLTQDGDAGNSLQVDADSTYSVMVTGLNGCVSSEYDTRWSDYSREEYQRAVQMAINDTLACAANEISR